MAEDTTIPLESGSESSSTEVGLESAEQTVSTEGVTAENAPQVPSDELTQKIANLEQQTAQYLRERQGWEAQSRRNMEEKNQLAERLANLEERLSARAEPDVQPQNGTSQSPGWLSTAFDKHLDGDKEGVAAIETDLMRRQQSQAQPEDLKTIIRQELVSLGSKSTLQQIVGTKHPDMTNPKSELSAAVYDQYDQYVTDPSIQHLYPQDERYEVPMIGPDGRQKMVDGRIVNNLAHELRLQGGIQEGRQQELQAQNVGTAQGGSGRQTQQPKTRAVEAAKLLTPGELALISDPQIRKGWPEMPAEPKAAAKYFYDLLEPSEQSKRVSDYRQATRVGV